MAINKAVVLNNICYTELVYGRINKKLNTGFSKQQIEELIYNIVLTTHEHFFKKSGKNIYVTNAENNIWVTINANNYRVITVDKIVVKK